MLQCTSMFERQVKCRNCGFLARHLGLPLEQRLKSTEERLAMKQLGLLEPLECNQRQRADMERTRITERFTIFCTRHVWSELDAEYGLEDVTTDIDDRLDSDRERRLFHRYEAGYSPLEHRVLQSENKSRNVLLIGTLVGAAIGAAAAIVAGLLTG